MSNHLDVAQPSPIVLKSANFLVDTDHVLDLACGSGRNGRYFLEKGYRVTFVDRNISGLEDLQEHPQATIIEIDLEVGGAWPLRGMQFDAVLVVNYLWRPILPYILEAVTPGGYIVYDTFAAGNEQYGKPTNPDYLLMENELLEKTEGQFSVAHFAHGYIDEPKPAIKQSLLAKRNHARFEYSKDGFVISDDPLRLDGDAIHDSRPQPLVIDEN